MCCLLIRLYLSFVKWHHPWSNVYFREAKQQWRKWFRPLNGWYDLLAFLMRFRQLITFPLRLLPVPTGNRKQPGFVQNWQISKSTLLISVFYTFWSMHMKTEGTNILSVHLVFRFFWGGWLSVCVSSGVGVLSSQRAGRPCTRVEKLSWWKVSRISKGADLWTHQEILRVSGRVDEVSWDRCKN